MKYKGTSSTYFYIEIYAYYISIYICSIFIISFHFIFQLQLAYDILVFRCTTVIYLLHNLQSDLAFTWHHNYNITDYLPYAVL